MWQDLAAYAPQDGKALVLKSLKSDMTAHGGFLWPESGMIAAPDWSEEPVCGQGLHGWLWGAGDASLQVTGEDVKWLVLSVDADKVVELNGKVKFPDCEVVYCGSRETAVMIIAAYAPAGTKTMFVTMVVGSRSTVDAGDGSTVKAGYGSTVDAGSRSTVDAGYGSTVDAGYGSTVKAGDGSTVKAGYGSTVKAGDGSTVKAGKNAVLICHVIDRVFVLVIDGINSLPTTTYKATYEGWVEATPEG